MSSCAVLLRCECFALKRTCLTRDGVFRDDYLLFSAATALLLVPAAWWSAAVERG